MQIGLDFFRIVKPDNRGLDHGVIRVGLPFFNDGDGLVVVFVDMGKSGVERAGVTFHRAQRQFGIVAGVDIRRKGHDELRRLVFSLQRDAILRHALGVLAAKLITVAVVHVHAAIIRADHFGGFVPYAAAFGVHQAVNVGAGFVDWERVGFAGGQFDPDHAVVVRTDAVFVQGNEAEFGILVQIWRGKWTL